MRFANVKNVMAAEIPMSVVFNTRECISDARTVRNSTAYERRICAFIE